MRKAILFVGVLALFGSLTPRLASAQSGTGGSGGGNGVTLGCGSATNSISQNVTACGSVSVLSTPSGDLLSAPMTLNVLTSNSGVESAVGDDLTPGQEALDFNFSFGPGTNQFTLGDFGTGGDADFEVTGTISSLVSSGNSSAGSWMLTLAPTSVIVGGSCECTGAGPISLAGLGVTGTMTINFDPGQVTGVSLGVSGGPFGGGSGPSPTPEPGTLLLLGSGLLGCATFVRRKFVRY